MYCSSSCQLVPLYHQTDFMQKLLKKNDKKLTWYFNFTLLCIYEVLALYNSNLVTMLIASIPLNLK